MVTLTLTFNNYHSSNDKNWTDYLQCNEIMLSSNHYQIIIAIYFFFLLVYNFPYLFIIPQIFEYHFYGLIKGNQMGLFIPNRIPGIYLTIIFSSCKFL